MNATQRKTLRNAHAEAVAADRLAGEESPRCWVGGMWVPSVVYHWANARYGAAMEAFRTAAKSARVNVENAWDAAQDGAL